MHTLSRVRKNRKVWWIVGGVGFVVLFVFSMLALRENPADAKMERTLNELFMQYRFELDRTNEDYVGVDHSVDLYISERVTPVELDEIVATIESACRGCTTRYGYYSNGDHWLNIFDMGKSYRSFGVIVVIRFPLGSDAEAPRRVDITVNRSPPPSLLERVKGWLPW